MYDTDNDLNDNDLTPLPVGNLLRLDSPSDSDSDSAFSRALLPRQSAAASAFPREQLPSATRAANLPLDQLLTFTSTSPTHQPTKHNAAFPATPTPFDTLPAIDDTRLDTTVSDSACADTACTSVPAMYQAPSTKKRRLDGHPSSGSSRAQVDGAVTQWMHARNQKKNEMDAAGMTQDDLQAARRLLSLLLPTTTLAIHKDPPLLCAHRRLPSKNQAVILLPPPPTMETADDDEADEDDSANDWAVVSVTKLAGDAIIDNQIHTATTRDFRATCQRVETILSTAMDMRAVNWKEIEWQQVPLPRLWDDLHDGSLTRLIQCVATKVLLIAGDSVSDRLFLWAWLGALVTTSGARARVSDIAKAVELPEKISRPVAEQIDHSCDDDDLSDAFSAMMSHARQLSSRSATLSHYQGELNLILRCTAEASSPEDTPDAIKKKELVKHLKGVLELCDEDSLDHRTYKEKLDEAEKQVARAESKPLQELHAWIALSNQTAEMERLNLEAAKVAYLNEIESQLVSMKEQIQYARQPLRFCMNT